MAELQSKYQKLAAEYSKLRAQLPVLKKAILDEQAKEELLKEEVKHKDLSIRKYEQELDSLLFRNQQLSSRVSVLQQELDESDAKAKKNKKWTVLGSTSKHQTHVGEQNNHPQYTSQSSVIGEELQNKIEENARLHRQVNDVSQEFEQTVSELQEKLMHLQAERSHHQEVLNAATLQNRTHIEKLQETKASLEVKMQAQEADIKKSHEMAYEAESRLVLVEDELTTKLHTAEHTLQTKLPFNDAENCLWNSLNVPPHDREQQLHTRELVGQAAVLIRELIQGLSNFYTYSEQRTKVYPVDVDTISDSNKKYCQILHENTTFLRPVEQAFKLFLESLNDDLLVTLDTATGLKEFSNKFRGLSSYLNKLLPYQRLNLEEESSTSSCTSSLEAKNLELYSCLGSFVSSFSKLETYISIIATQSDVFDKHPKSSHMKIFEILASAAVSLHETTRDLSKHYGDKVSMEHDLPTATQKLRTTNDCILSALNSLVTCTSKISTFLNGNLEFFRRVLSYEGKGVNSDRIHPSVNNYRQRAAQYMSMISRPCPESVPYKTALHNQRTLVSSTESRDTLAQQVVGYQEKICKLEQEKEHWMLESQLVQMKYSKEIKKVSELEQKVRLLEARLTGSIEDNLEAVAAHKHPEDLMSVDEQSTSQTNPVTTSLLGQVETEGTVDPDKDNREHLIRQHFSNRLLELTSQLQLTDSKALYFHAECRALHQQLQQYKQDGCSIQTQLSQANQANAQLKDELQTTTRSYEAQLSMLSEHLAAINERLAVQKDEIDILKFQLSLANKGNKKGRLK